MREPGKFGYGKKNDGPPTMSMSNIFPKTCECLTLDGRRDIRLLMELSLLISQPTIE